jgi:hypothetical protein
MKLGKKPARHDERTLKLSDYIQKLPPAPRNGGYLSKVSAWQMYGNNTYGDCVCAAAGHDIQQWLAYTGGPLQPPNVGEVLAIYKKLSPNDDGLVILDFLNYWKANGFADFPLGAYVSVDHTNIDELKQAIFLFGSVFIGLGLPITAQTAPVGVNGYPTWEILSDGNPADAEPGSWGGHCVALPFFSSNEKGYLWNFNAITWGTVYNMTPDFLASYCDEAYALLSPAWIAANGLAPSGFDMAQLQADLAAL